MEIKIREKLTVENPPNIAKIQVVRSPEVRKPWRILAARRPWRRLGLEAVLQLLSGVSRVDLVKVCSENGRGSGVGKGGVKLL